jgi:signal transduction histidine kinase
MKEPSGVGVDALSAIHEITAKIVASLDLDQTLATIARAMCEILAADIGAIYLIDEEAGLLRLRGIHGEQSPAWAGHTMSLDRGMNAMAIRTGQIQRVDDYLRFPPELRAQTPVVGDEPMRAVIAAPMMHRGRRLGSMGAVRREPRAFNDKELVLLEMLADHASIAVANALDFEELETLRARETTQLREHADRMASLEKAKSDFLQLASHELRSPVAVIRGYLSMLDEGTVPQADFPRVLRMLMGKTERMNLLINEMLETARLEAGPIDLHMREMDLRVALQSSVTRMQPLLPAESPIALTMPDEPVPVSIDEARIDILIANLLDNAVKYSRGTPRVECSLRVHDGTASIEIRDCGIGIDPRDFPRLFQRFSRISSEATRSIGGTGLGLFLARELARQHGGDIAVESQPGKGSAFVLSLPLAHAEAAHVGH